MNTTNVEGPLLIAKPSRIQEASNPEREGGVVSSRKDKTRVHWRLLSRISFLCISRRRDASENMRLQLKAPCQETKYLPVAKKATNPPDEACWSSCSYHLHW